MQLARSLATLAVAVSLTSCGAPAPAESAPAPSASSAAAAASPAASASPSAAASDTTSAELETLLAQGVSTAVEVSDPGPALDRAEQDMTAFMRDAGGVATLLGPNGSAILAGVDDAERQAIAALVTKLRAQAPAPGAGVPTTDVARGRSMPTPARLASAVGPVMPGGSVGNAQEGGESLFGAFMFTMMAPELYARAGRDANGNLERQTMTQEMTTSDGSTIRLTLQPSLTGSTLNAEVKVTIDVPGPPAYREEASGTLTVNLCPDANGKVPLRLSLGGGFSLLGGGMQYHVTVTATGQVNDEGKLASIDVQSDGNMASQPLTGQGSLGTAPMYIELAMGYNVALAGGAVSNAHASAPRYSSRVDVPFVRKAISMTSDMGSIATVLGFASAERLWTTGYCLAITVPEMTGSSKRVDPGSVTPFTAVVNHKFETAELHVPVTATLASGAVSVTPSGTKVPAPAAFRYTAPGDLDKTATVSLETRSKRGVATLTVELRTGLASYRASWQDKGTVWSGIVCGLDRPFTITVVTPGGDLTMPFEFAPSSPAGGTVTFDVTKYGTHWTGSGPYAVKATGTGQLSLVGQIRGSYTASGKTGYYPIPFDVPLTPLTTNECGTR